MFWILCCRRFGCCGVAGAAAMLLGAAWAVEDVTDLTVWMQSLSLFVWKGINCEGERILHGYVLLLPAAGHDTSRTVEFTGISSADAVSGIAAVASHSAVVQPAYAL